MIAARQTVRVEKSPLHCSSQASTLQPKRSKEVAISELERVSQREEGEVEEKVRKVATTRRESSASCAFVFSLAPPPPN